MSHLPAVHIKLCLYWKLVSHLMFWRFECVVYVSRGSKAAKAAQKRSLHYYRCYRVSSSCLAKMKGHPSKDGNRTPDVVETRARAWRRAQSGAKGKYGCLKIHASGLNTVLKYPSPGIWTNTFASPSMSASINGRRSKNNARSVGPRSPEDVRPAASARHPSVKNRPQSRFEILHTKKSDFQFILSFVRES